MSDNIDSAFEILKTGFTRAALHVQDHVAKVNKARETDEKRTTELGTPCSRAWDSAWIKTVNEKETELGRRVCGARSTAGGVCTIRAQHPNGRCRFHGGYDFTGADKGNRNAVVHGLYSRRLMVCGPQCAVWQSCPCAGPDIEALDKQERPVCPFELAEYNAMLSDNLAFADGRQDPRAVDRQLAHFMALLHVMMSRSLAAMGRDGAVAQAEAKASADRPGPGMRTLMRLMSEYRHIRQMIPEPGEDDGPVETSAVEHALRREVDTDLTPEGQAELHMPPDPHEVLKTGLINLQRGAAIRGPRPDVQAHPPKWEGEGQV
ncbi:MAG: hypothetical protein AMXMBFR84_35040 [Candidatus Hydrogenedentota bacterium]